VINRNKEIIEMRYLEDGASGSKDDNVWIVG
jgi:hypothetical protein